MPTKDGRPALWFGLLISLVQLCCDVSPVAAAESKPVGKPVDHFGDKLPPGAVARLGTIRLRHAHVVTAVRFSPDGKLLASTGLDGALRFWDAATGAPKGKPLFLADTTVTLAFSPDGKTLACSINSSRAADDKPTILLWDIQAGKELWRRRGQEDIFETLAFSPDGKSLVSGANKTIRLWAVADGSELHRLDEYSNRWGVAAFSPDGKRLFTCSVKSVSIWDVATGQQLPGFEHGIDNVSYLALSPDGKLVIIGGSIDVVELRDVASGKLVRQIKTKTHSLALSPDGKTLAGGKWEQMEEAVELWDVASGKRLRCLDGHEDHVRSMAFSPDGKTVAAASGNAIRLWDNASGKERLPSPGHHNPVSVVTLAADGKSFATAGGRSLCVWELPSGKSIGRLRYESEWPAVTGATLSADGSRAMAWDWKKLYSWDVRKAGRSQLILDREDSKQRGHFGEHLIFSADHRQVVTWDRSPFRFGPACMSGINLCEVSTGKRLRSLTIGNDGHAGSVALSPDGRWVAASEDKSMFDATSPVRLWRMSTGEEVKQFHLSAVKKDYRGISCLAFSLCGRTLVAATHEGWLELWNTEASVEPFVLTGHQGAIHAVAVSPDSRMVASAGADGTVRLWETTTGQERVRFTGQGGELLSAAFSPDGKFVITGGKETTAVIWDVNSLLDGTEYRDAEQLWADLAGDPQRSYRAMRLLAQSPGRGVTILRDRLSPVKVADAAHLAQLIADLDSPKYRVRLAARESLLKLGDQAEPPLRRCLASRPSLEMRRQIDRLLAELVDQRWRPQGENLRYVRAVEVLERVATAESISLLKKLTQGAAGARLTKDAASALRRLDRKKAD